MTDEQQERLIRAFEASASAQIRIAQSLESLHGTAQAAIRHQWPDQRPPREAVVTRVPTEADKVRETQTGNAKSTDEWLNEVIGDEREFVGEREREWLVEQERSKQDSAKQGGTPNPQDASPETPKGEV